MQAGAEYDYFFEVDGERKYDFDLDFRAVDLYDYPQTAQSDDHHMSNKVKMMRQRVSCQQIYAN